MNSATSHNEEQNKRNKRRLILGVIVVAVVVTPVVIAAVFVVVTLHPEAWTGEQPRRPPPVTVTYSLTGTATNASLTMSMPGGTEMAGECQRALVH